MRRSLVGLAISLVAVSCGGHQGYPAAHASKWRALMIVEHRRMAPDFELRDQFGRLVSPRAERGHAAVAITFVYSHCRNICPLILEDLARLHDRYGARFVVLGVSIDPRGDRPAHVRRFLAERGLLHEVHFLMGTTRQLAPVWRAYEVGSRRHPTQLDPQSVEHTAVIYGVGRSGLIRTLYPGDPYDPRPLVHDAPLLLHA